MSPIRLNTTLRTALVLCLAAASAAAQSVMSQNHEVVLAVGSPVPGPLGVAGATINPTSNFDSPVLDQDGTMLFRARMLGGGVTGADDRAYFMGRGASDLQLVVRAGDQAPGLPAGLLLRSSSATAGSGGLSGSPRISPFGEFLFFQSAVFDPNNPTPTTADSALFWGNVGNLVSVAREGDVVPFLSGETWGALTGSLQTNHINAGGVILFNAPLVGATTTTDNVMVTGVPGGLVPVLREGDVLSPGGEVIVPLPNTSLNNGGTLNAVGQVLVEVRFEVAGAVTATNDRALMLWSPGVGLQFIAREGDQAPGLPVGAVFKDTVSFNGWSANAGTACFNVLGQCLFASKIEDGGTTAVDDQALYLGAAGGNTLVLRKGDACPGLPGVLFGNVNMSGTTLTDSGIIASVIGLQGSVTTADDSSIWYGTPGNLALLAREGDVVPGLAPSGNGPWKYGSIAAGTGTPYLTARGTVMFQNTLSDGVATRSVLLGYTPEAGIRLLLDAGETFTTINGTGAWTGIGSTGMNNSSDGGVSWFNSQGDFATRLGLAAPLTAAIVRGRAGLLQANPASFSQVGGGTQNFAFDFGAAHGNEVYALIGSASGTRPGSPSPIGPQQLPLNWDNWTDISLQHANSLVYFNTIGFLDADGKGASSFWVPGGYTWDPQLHHVVVSLTTNVVSTAVSDASAVRLW